MFLVPKIESKGTSLMNWASIHESKEAGENFLVLFP